MEFMEIFQNGRGWVPWLAVTAIAAGGALMTAAAYLQIRRFRIRFSTPDARTARPGRSAKRTETGVRTPSPASRTVAAGAYRQQAGTAGKTPPAARQSSRRPIPQDAVIATLKRISGLRTRLERAVTELEDRQSARTAARFAGNGMTPAVTAANLEIEYLNRGLEPQADS